VSPDLGLTSCLPDIAVSLYKALINLVIAAQALELHVDTERIATGDMFSDATVRTVQVSNHIITKPIHLTDEKEYPYRPPLPKTGSMLAT
jgi:hypothetical protein